MSDTNHEQKLEKSLLTLTTAMAASEQRAQKLDKMVRLLTLAVAMLTTIALLPKLEWLVPGAQAQTDSGKTTLLQKEMGLAVDDLNHIQSIIVNLDKLLTGAVNLAGNPQTAATLQKLNNLLNLADAATTNPQMAKVATDAMTLVVRIKQDSDTLRRNLLTPAQLASAKGNATKLEQIINENPPVPSTQQLMGIQSAIRDEIRFLNGNIHAMVLSIDSTMGRMGRFMSPWPFTR
ncbi:MAG: hypothetical protein HQM03_09990 [Magnetococcales bacterium]|nr:hypothetical protein [Magnetococcales bacterium]